MGRVISCSDAVRHLWEYLDRGLTDDDRQAVDEHLDYCIQCCGELDFAKELQRLMRRTDPVGLPGDVQERLVRFIDDLPTEDGTGGRA